MKVCAGFQRVGSLRRFGLQTGIDILVWNRIWFLRELRECMNYSLFQFQMSKKERAICEFAMDFEKSFLLLL